MDVIYGQATDKTFIKMDKEMHEDEWIMDWKI
jgi:hypothetical protein